MLYIACNPPPFPPPKKNASVKVNKIAGNDANNRQSDHVKKIPD